MKYIVSIVLFLSMLQGLAQSTFRNPILPGAYPDPSICRVGDDYYLVNSSFEYFPGVPIWHSKDLVNWELIGHAVTRAKQFDYSGICSSCGFWAPSIRFHKGLYYLSVTWVDWRMKVGFKNVILTATNPAGPWSDPSVITDDIWGIDPAIFFDDDGKNYWLMNHPAEPGAHQGASTIMIQQIDLAAMKLIGEKKIIGKGAQIDAKYAEGPKMFKKDGYYYLFIAEGGTGVNHAVTVSRSKNIEGPYENFQGNPILTHRNMGYTSPIINIGHADIVKTANKEWWMVCLGSRTLAGTDNIFGRETYLVPMTWDKDQWPIVSPQYGQVRAEERKPNLPEFKAAQFASKDDFETSSLLPYWVTIRIPKENTYHLKNKGFLTLNLQSCSLKELSEPAFVGQRLRYKQGDIITNLSFQPKSEKEEAGLAIYKSDKAYLRYVLSKNKNGNILTIISRKDSFEVVLFRKEILDINALQLKIIQQENKFTFYYSESQNAWQLAYKDFTGSLFSVEESGGFMGTMVGMYASSNGSESKNFAKFDWFDYILKN
ncbi:MAG: glycoside hydrolase family 43 protein [Cytophagales bacterium]|nr:MAG: glycoside hydrolase family 43 protein [Cytophagales bacterium]